MFTRMWPRSLQGQLLLGIALAVLLAQGISATLLWRAQVERREAALIHTAAIRIVTASREAAEAADHHFRREQPVIDPLEQFLALVPRRLHEAGQARGVEARRNWPAPKSGTL